jgi:8-oxo-dGTP pyrophosphatase MutT (NUDIX family)
VSKEPRPAATLILLRRGGHHSARGLEVLMVRRSTEASFMPGVWVFPGGVVEPDEDLGRLEGDDGLDDEERAHRACAARELHEEAGVDLPKDTELVAWSRWITPEPVPVRFDTRFYIALAPPHAAPVPDAAEVSEAAWFAPEAALDRGEAGEISLVFPTIKHLESLVPFATAEEALAAARERVVEPILPRVVGTREDHRVVLPGDPDY